MIKGFVELLRPFQVRGWAYDADAPEQAVHVTLWIDGEKACSGLADGFRSDLVDAGVGDGRHGFILNFDKRLSATEQNSVHVEATASGSNGPVRLPLMPNLTVVDPAQPAVAPVNRVSSIKGFFNLASPFEVVGWAYASDEPDDHVSVNVLVDGQRVGSVIADEFRPDLLIAMVGSGDHGFTVRVDQRLPLEDESRIEVQARSRTGEAASLQLLPADNSEAQAATFSNNGQILAFPAQDVDRSQRPVFILGAARSGTSAMAQALMRATRYVGHEEGHLLDLIGPMFGCISRHYGERGEEWSGRDSTLISAVPKAFLESGVKRIFVDLARSLFPAGWWLDKTPRPGMIAVAPLLREVWPEARFIFMKRRGIENIASRMRKFPAMPFEDHCRDWALVMQSWMAARQALAGVSIEIDQLCLATQPDRVADALAPMLLLQPNEVADLTRTLASDRPERTSARFGETESLSFMQWTPDQRRTFTDTCGALMRTFGYGTGSDYFLDGQEDRGLKAA